jgi:malate dehydrogenase
MTVIGAGHVEQAHRDKSALRVSPKDLVTPLARERAAELGVEIIKGQAQGDAPATPSRATASPGAGASNGSSTRPAAATRPATSPVPAPAGGGALFRERPEVGPATVNTLFRRGAPVSAGMRRDGSGARPRVAVIGAGHVGSITALRLAESDLFDEIVLVDVVDGLAAGIALDLWHSAGLARFATTIRGTSEMDDIAGVDYVVLTAGKARKPGMTRTDLTAANADIVGPVAERIAAVAPDSVIVVVTNPLEEMTHLTRIHSRFPTERVLGMAGVLDSVRFCSLVALTGVGRPDEVHAFALGSHGPEMVVPLSLATVHGRPLREALDAATLDEIVARTRDSGAEVVALLKSGSAYFAPGQSAAQMVTAMASGSDQVLACAVEPDGQYGLRNTRVGLPVRLGPRGLVEIVELALEPAELQALRDAADRLGTRIQEVTPDASGGLRRTG